VVDFIGQKVEDKRIEMAKDYLNILRPTHLVQM